MRFIQYTRKSSEGDERQVQSIPDQNSVLDRFAEQTGLSVVHKIEEAHSAKRPGSRPLFAEMLALIEAGQADGILCWHLNRLSRNPVDSGRLSWLLQQGIIRCIKTPEREYRPEDNVVIMAVENAVANQYILDLRRNIERAQVEKARRGWYPRRPPIGYLTNRETGEIEADPKRFPLLRRAWDLMLTGSYTVVEIYRLLTIWGLRGRPGKGKDGKPLVRARIYQLFDEPFYYGRFRFQGELHEGRHRPLVSREEFDRVQELIHQPSLRRHRKHSFAYTGLIRCGGCGCLITAEHKTKHYRTSGRRVRYTYYHCTRSKGCRQPSVTKAYLDGQIARKLERCRFNLNAVEWARKAIEREQGDPSWSAGLLRTHLQNLQTARQKLKRLYDLRLADEVSAGEFGHLKATISEEVSQLEGAIERLKNRGERNRETINNLYNFVAEAAELFTEEEEKSRRQIAGLLGKSYLLTLGELYIQPHPLLEPLLTLEPPTSPHNMGRRRSGATQNPTQCSQRDRILTLLETTDVAFPKLEIIQQVQLPDDEVA